MSADDKPSILVRVSSLSFFVILAFGSLLWFSFSLIKLIYELLEIPVVISFDKGSMYMLGGGVAAILFSIGGVVQGVLEKKMSPKLESCLSKAIITSLVFMFGFPHISHYAVSSFLKSRNYLHCDEAGYGWLLYRKIYYTRDGAVCAELVKKDNA